MPDEFALQKLIFKLESLNIQHTVFREPDIDSQITAIAIEPGEKSYKAVSSLPLALKSYNTGLDKNKFAHNSSG